MDSIEIKLRLLAKLTWHEDQVRAIRVRHSLRGSHLTHTADFRDSAEDSLSLAKMKALLRDAKELMDNLNILPRWQSQITNYLIYGDMEVTGGRVRLGDIIGEPFLYLDENISLQDIEREWRDIKEFAKKSRGNDFTPKRVRGSLAAKKYWQVWQLKYYAKPKLTKQQIADQLEIGVYTAVDDMLKQVKAWIKDPI